MTQKYNLPLVIISKYDKIQAKDVRGDRIYESADD